MSDEKKEVKIDESAVPKPVDNTPDYLAAMNEIRKNSVDKGAYEKILEENKRLIKAMSEGNYQSKEDNSRDLNKENDELRQIIFGNDNVLNMDGFAATLQLRNNLLEQGKEDIFLPNGHAESEYEVNEANRVALGIQHCLEVADGDPAVFTNEFFRILVDVPRMKR